MNARQHLVVVMAALLGLWSGCGGGEDDDEAVFTTAVGPVPGGGGPADDADDEEMTTGGDMDAMTGGFDDDADTGGAPPPPDNGDTGAPPPPAGDSGGDGNADTPADQCYAQATNACENCACDNCLPQLMACEADLGCIAIRICAQAHMCTGIDCLGPCGEVIDNNGGPFGDSAGLATAVSDCVQAANCGC